MMKSFSICIFVTVAALVLSACSFEAGPKLQKSPIGEMAIGAPEGYGNKTAAARNQDGIDHLLREHWRKAEADFDRALEADPDLAAAHFNLALSLDQQEKRTEAGMHFKKAVALAPRDHQIRENDILKKYLTKE
jgi:Tfp pilus assembly protein PilF